MFDKALFRPTLKPLSREALAILAQENRSGSESNVRVHPVIEESRWSVQDMSGTIYVFNNFDDFVLDILVARNECATCPAIDRVKVIIRGYRTFSIDGIRCLIHEESAMIEHEASDGEQRRPVTMEELARSLFELEALWSVEDDDDDFGLPFPNEHDRVSAELLPDGSLVVMQEMNDYIIDDYYWSPPRDDGASEFELLAGTSFRHSTATHSSPSTLP
ncbi:hypothetical protein A4X13_0g1121 [Tilletia indica]|uniref:Uncharacterized protein n=1 Tax=Tilletia indica TaxID=43049 RepID=A0A8T8TF00_9BASI|nr:hypothetical protein A4X13_0g1121 [Tilletia indica]